MLDIRQIILNDDLASLKEFIDYPDVHVKCASKHSVHDDCKKLFIDCLLSYSIEAVSSKAETPRDPTQKIRYKIAKLLIESSNIDLNTSVEFIYKGQKYILTPFEIVLAHFDTDMIYFLVTQPVFKVGIFHLEMLQEKIGKSHADHINNSLINLIRLYQIKLIQNFIANRKKNPNKQAGPINKLFGGIDMDFKISAAEFLLTNINNILSIETHSEYKTHEPALKQGHSFYGLQAIFKAIIKVETAIEIWEKRSQNPIHDAEINIELDLLKRSTNNIGININSFHSAIITNQLESVKTFLNKYPQLLNSLDTFKISNLIHINFPRVTPLHLAVMYNHVDIIKYLLSFSDINLNAKAYYCHRDPKIHLTPLSYATEHAKIQAIGLLLEQQNIEVSLADFKALSNVLRETKNVNDLTEIANLVYLCENKLVKSRIQVLINSPEPNSTLGQLRGICKSKKIAALRYILTNLEVDNGILSIRDTDFYPQVEQALNEGQTKQILDAIINAEIYIKVIKKMFPTISYRNSCILVKPC